MNLDVQRLRRFAPVVAPVVVVAVGWMLLVAPALSRRSRAASEIDSLRQRLIQVRASVSGPLPQAPAGNPVTSFERAVSAGDASSVVLEQLAVLAAGAGARNLLIETAERVVINASTGPQVASSVHTDPRLGLFDAPLSYSPVSMSFDGEFSSVGELMWRMRGLATTVEIRGVDIKPIPADTTRVHVALYLFAYARSPRTSGAGALQ